MPLLSPARLVSFKTVSSPRVNLPEQRSLVRSNVNMGKSPPPPFDLFRGAPSGLPLLPNSYSLARSRCWHSFPRPHRHLLSKAIRIWKDQTGAAPCYDTPTSCQASFVRSTASPLPPRLDWRWREMSKLEGWREGQARLPDESEGEEGWRNDAAMKRMMLFLSSTETR